MRRRTSWVTLGEGLAAAAIIPGTAYPEGASRWLVLAVLLTVAVAGVMVLYDETLGRFRQAAGRP